MLDDGILSVVMSTLGGAIVWFIRDWFTGNRIYTEENKKNNPNTKLETKPTIIIEEATKVYPKTIKQKKKLS